MGASLNRGGKKSIFAGYYFHLEPGGKSFAGGGLWMPMAPDLKKVRQEIDYCLADFSNYYHNNGTPDYQKFPAIKYAKGYDVILEHGDTLFMPAGFWHHMEYLDSGFAMSLRALQPSIGGKLKGVWNLFGMRSIDTLLKKMLPKWWYGYKMKKIEKSAKAVLKKYEN